MLIKQALAGNWQYVDYYLSTEDLEPYAIEFLRCIESYDSIIGENIAGQIMGTYTPKTPHLQSMFAEYFYKIKRFIQARSYFKLAADQGITKSQKHIGYVQR